MRSLTGMALLTLLAAPAVAQTAAPGTGYRCDGLLPMTAMAPAAGTVAIGAPALGVGSNPIEPRRDPVDTRLEPNTGRAGVGVGTGAVPNVAATGAVGAPGVAGGETLTRPTPVSAIKDKDVYNLRGEELGEIERVILGQGDQVYAVLEFGGFLGIGEKKRIVPLRALMLREDRIVMPCVSEAALEGLPEWRDGTAGYRDLESTYMAPFGLYR